jgi:hypothetical protein
VAQLNGVEVFDLSQHLCPKSQCMYVSNGNLLYFDSNHLTAEGAVIALKGFPINAGK